MRGNEMAKKIVRSLTDGTTWRFIHLEYPDSGRTGKFYRICAPESGNGRVLTQWGARPSPTFGPAFGERGQTSYVSRSKARELLDQKVNKKGYRVVVQGSFLAPKDATRQKIITGMQEAIAEGGDGSLSELPMYSVL